MLLYTWQNEPTLAIFTWDWLQSALMWCPGACLENEVVNPAFDTIRIKDEFIFQTRAGYFLELKSLSAVIVSTILRKALANFFQKIKFRRLEAYAELDSQCFQLSRNISDKKKKKKKKKLWITTSGCKATWAIAKWKVKGYLIYEWWMSHKYRENGQFSSPLFKMMRVSSNINGWEAFHYSTSVFLHIFWYFVLCVQEHIWFMHVSPSCFIVFISVFVCVRFCLWVPCVTNAMQSSFFLILINANRS